MKLRILQSSKKITLKLKGGPEERGPRNISFEGSQFSFFLSIFTKKDEKKYYAISELLFYFMIMIYFESEFHEAY